jgi:hypothetical protein
MRVLYNVCFGGFGIQNVVLGELRLGPTREELPEFCRQDEVRCEALRNNETPPETPLIDKYSREWRGCKRTNAALIDRVMRGESVGGPFAQLAVAEFDDAFADFWSIDEYNGSESVVLDKGKWMLAELDKLGDAGVPTLEQIAEWKRLLQHEPVPIYKQAKRDTPRADEWEWHEV